MFFKKKLGPEINLRASQNFLTQGKNTKTRKAIQAKLKNPKPWGEKFR